MRLWPRLVRSGRSPTQSLDPLFFKREFRKVNQDATISLGKRLYEVPPRFVGQRVEVRFDPSVPEEIHIFENDVSVFITRPVNFADNARVKRSREGSISFKQLMEVK